MKYPIAIEPGDETKAWSVVVPDLAGCFSAADSGIDEARENGETRSGYIAHLAIQS